MQIRFGQLQDATAAVAVLRGSIRELCHADHLGDADRIESWLANKTPKAWALWIANPDARVYAATDSGRILGVGMMTTSGEILLNYVLPAARFQGVSKALIGAMEAEAVALGLDTCSLDSTRTAEAFYLAPGYRPVAGASERVPRKLLKVAG